MRKLSLVLICALLATSVSLANEVPSFQNDVMAVLSRAGCNSGPCHGNLNGKGYFKLSLRGENPQEDYAAIVEQFQGRRISTDSPTESLILRKAVLSLPHEGGPRFKKSSKEYALIRDWIRAGAKFDQEAPKPVKLHVEPREQVVFSPQDRLQLNVKVEWPDGRIESIADLATFETTTVGVASVSECGEVRREQFGELVVLVRYLHLMVPVRLAFVDDRPAADFTHFEAKNRIDDYARKPWETLRITPALLANDEVFLRRVYLDVIGVPPTVAEAKQFLESTDPNKRAKLIDELLERPEYAQFWALKWGDLLRNEEKSLDRKGVQIFHRWLKETVALDRPLNEFAAEILTARGNTYTTPQANFYRAIRDPYLRAESVAQVFLGLRISCAKCHNHPFDRWTQDDYHRFAGNFARIGYRVLENNKRDELDSHEFNGEQIVYRLINGELKHPQGGDALPKLLAGESVRGDEDRLDRLAAWIASPENRFFAPAQVNRIWLHLMGRGLVDPNDDFRESNPPSNPELLAYLIEEFRASGFRTKHLIRLITNSATYQRAASQAALGEAVAEPQDHFATAHVKPLPAEVLLDAVAQALDSPVPYPGYPLGTRAGELAATPQTGRGGSAAESMRFLKVFGKPERLLTCECERTEDPGMLQAFQLMTGNLLNELLRNKQNRLTRLVETQASTEEKLTELYLATLVRKPNDSEIASLRRILEESTNPRKTWEDIAWSLLNSKEFLLRR